jgi:hypothetical protein
MRIMKKQIMFLVILRRHKHRDRLPPVPVRYSRLPVLQASAGGFEGARYTRGLPAMFGWITSGSSQ